MQRRHIQPFNPKATIAILKEDPKAGDELDESQKRVLVDRYLEVSFDCTLLKFKRQFLIKNTNSPLHSLSN